MDRVATHEKETKANTICGILTNRFAVWFIVGALHIAQALVAIGAGSRGSTPCD